MLDREASDLPVDAGKGERIYEKGLDSLTKHLGEDGIETSRRVYLERVCFTARIAAAAAKTAKALGLTIPPSLLQRADQVIE